MLPICNYLSQLGPVTWFHGQHQDLYRQEIDQVQIEGRTSLSSLDIGFDFNEIHSAIDRSSTNLRRASLSDTAAGGGNGNDGRSTTLGTAGGRWGGSMPMSL